MRRAGSGPGCNVGTSSKEDTVNCMCGSRNEPALPSHLGQAGARYRSWAMLRAGYEDIHVTCHLGARSNASIAPLCETTPPQVSHSRPQPSASLNDNRRPLLPTPRREHVPVRPPCHQPPPAQPYRRATREVANADRGARPTNQTAERPTRGTARGQRLRRLSPSCRCVRSIPKLHVPQP